ncbi:MAG: hypothetical protein HYT88_06005 [Candidatus Omnitrophica bacterium]|nr:hypothetical protein [Candidatus Omnitrophota bacterium]MBI2174332.1 hypothetical protein [Candidatus Omnitrophota bacterium]MBI3009976.1 hypothetical protein [Candidatus Omnitrophota bacterium]
MARRIITKRLGELLLERGVINRKQLDQALAHQKEHGGMMIGQILVQLGFVNEEEIALALTAQYGFPYLPLDNYEIDSTLVSVIPEVMCRQYCLIPIDRIGNALTLAMSDPSNTRAVEEIEVLSKCVVQAFVSTPSDILKAIEKHYKQPQQPPSPTRSDSESAKS